MALFLVSGHHSVLVFTTLVHIARLGSCIKTLFVFYPVASWHAFFMLAWVYKYPGSYESSLKKELDLELVLDHLIFTT